jgi:hypothetical protein
MSMVVVVRAAGRPSRGEELDGGNEAIQIRLGVISVASVWKRLRTPSPVISGLLGIMVHFV